MKTHVILFQPRFARLVESGAKRQTIRQRDRLPDPGDCLSLREWTGLPYRSKQRLIKESACESVVPVCFNRNEWVRVGKELLAPSDEDILAVSDGFENRRDMWEWFKATHKLPYSGHIISWI